MMFIQQAKYNIHAICYHVLFLLLIHPSTILIGTIL